MFVGNHDRSEKMENEQLGCKYERIIRIETYQQLQKRNISGLEPISYVSKSDLSHEKVFLGAVAAVGVGEMRP